LIPFIFAVSLLVPRGKKFCIFPIVKLIKVVLVNMLGRGRISAVSRVEFFDRVCNSDGTLV
jgi:hypothetical protein